MPSVLKSIITLLLVCTLSAGAGLLAAKAYDAMTAPAAFTEGDYSEKLAQTGESVLMLGAQWCSYCAKAREHFKAKGVSFAELDIDTSEQANQWMAELGANGVPVILIGNRQIRGFRPQEIDDALALVTR